MVSSMLPDHSWARSSGDKHEVSSVASTSVGEAGISAGPGEIGASDDAGTLIVVLVLRGRML